MSSDTLMRVKHESLVTRAQLSFKYFLVAEDDLRPKYTHSNDDFDTCAAKGANLMLGCKKLRVWFGGPRLDATDSNFVFGSTREISQISIRKIFLHKENLHQFTSFSTNLELYASF